MRARVFTVGSLIPGRIIERPVQVPVTVHVEKTVSKPATIIIQQNGDSFEITREKGKLLDAALHQGKPIQYKCRKGTCGQCAVKMVQAEGMSVPNEQEHKKLKSQIANGFRLACQAEIL